MNCANEFDNKQKKPSKNNTNLDIRNYFKQTPSQLTINKRIMKVIEPYINEINEENYTLRKRKIVNYKKKFEPSDDEADSLNENEHDEEKEDKSSTPFGSQEASELSDVDSNKKRRYKKKKESKKKRRVEDKSSSDSFSLDEDGNEFEQDYIELRSGKGFNKLLIEAANTITEAEQEIKRLEKEFYTRENMINESKSNYPEHCIPICADIREFKFKALAEKQKEITGQLFDVIMMDPPWQLSSSQPTRGVAIAYDTLNDNIITDIPVQKLQTDGFIFIWTINAKFKVTLDLIKQWGYEYCDEIVWVKQTVNGKIAKGHGYYLQHTKETCLVGIKGNPKYNQNVFCDVIFSKRRGQSQKPEEIYNYIEDLIPNGYYLEIFGRRNNLRNYWVTIGNEL